VPYLLLADLVLFIHFAIVVFVVGGLVIIFAGNWCSWHWVNGWWFRLCHLSAIAVIVAQAWLGKLCPLTTLESWLRVRGGEVGYTDSFISHWLRNIIYYEAPLWVFTLIYTLLALLVLAAWWLFPPTRHKHGHQSVEGS
jgi:polyferredoxin